MKTQRVFCVWAEAGQGLGTWWEDTLDLESVSSTCLSLWTIGQGQVSPSPQLSALPHPVSWRATPMRHEPGAGRSDGQAWHLNPCPAVVLWGLCRGDGGCVEVHLSTEKEKKGVQAVAHPTNSLLLGIQELLTLPYRNLQCLSEVGAPLCAGLLLKKGVLWW